MARVIFLGTPEFAVPALQALFDHPDLSVVGVVTQPDRPAGRGQRVTASPIKLHAEKLGLPVVQPASLRDLGVVDALRAWQPDVLVVTAFGQILRQPVLKLAPHGCINVHASLLPRWRGAAPIPYAIRAGDQETGITIMRMDAGLDTGPIVAQYSIPIAPRETGASLHDKLAQLGAQVLPPALLAYLSGELTPRPQPEGGITLAPSLQRSAGQIEWSQSAVEIDRQVRAYNPWPGTFTYLGNDLLKVICGIPRPDLSYECSAGTIVLEAGKLAVQTGGGVYVMEEIQPAGKKQMTGLAFLAGHPNVPGKILRSP